ncbi:hypothetical protein [uncultured Flavobacterium sp.]|jgi:hypothetical protein|uniref:hypothetical protein n=1 Tax=uncultured Flavobacterium sp. TaxID=165435 RepID=UPI0030CA3035
MIKKLFLALILMATFIVSAQEGTSSPYSFYGLGDVKFKGTHDQRSMGGLGVAYDSIHLNLLNPASYSKLRITNFVVGGTSTFSNVSNQDSKESAKRTSLDYLALGFPIGKFGVAIGLMPYSSVGYNIQNSTSNVDLRTSIFKGQGGVNRVFTGFGFNLSETVSFGMDLQYNFGNIDTKTIVFIPNVILGSRELNESSINGFSSNFGLLYSKNLKNTLTFSSSINYTPEAKLNSVNTRNIATVSYTLTGSEIINDNNDIDVNDTKLVIPSTYKLGAGIGESKKWFVGFEYAYQENSKQGNRFDDISGTTFENSNKFVLGGYYIPKYNSFSSYWSKVAYRAGFRHENTGLVLNSESINDFGINFGLGFPVAGKLSNINIGFEYGKKGTIKNNLIQENYFSLNIGLSLNDLWFEKRKYD